MLHGLRGETSYQKMGKKIPMVQWQFREGKDHAIGDEVLKRVVVYEVTARTKKGEPVL